MKTTFLALSLVATLAACGGGAANNAAGAAGNSANTNAGLPTPPERPADQSAQPAAMPPGLDCVRNRLSPAERREAAAAAMEQVQRDDPRAQTLIAAVDACAAELSWSPGKRRAAGIFSLSAAGASGLREALAGAGIRVEQLDQTIITDQELMAAAAAGDLGNSPAGQQFAQRHEATIERMLAGRSDIQTVGTQIGAYIAFRASAEAAARAYANER